MPEDELGPAIRRRQLGRQLRELRREAGYSTIEAAAKRSGLSRASISRIESAKQTILPRTVLTLCHAYGVGQPLLDHLLSLAEKSDDRGWLVQYSQSVPDWFARYVGEEADAAEIWVYAVECVPGLLQTDDYIRAIMAAAQPSVTEAELARSVAFRRARQGRLSGDSPPRLIAVINEAALRRPVGGEGVMREQLQRLVELAEQPNITVQVLPFTAGAHPAMINPFNVLLFAADAGDPTIYVEVMGGALYPDRPADVDRYTWAMGRLRELAISPGATLAMIRTLIPE